MFTLETNSEEGRMRGKHHVASPQASQARGEKFTIGDYLVLEHKLGRGTYAKVYKGIQRSTGKLVAVKVMDVRRLGNQKESLLQEIEIMSTLTHPNIVELYDVFVDTDRIFIFLELMEGGDCSHYLKDHSPLEQGVAKAFILQLVEGIKFLHQHGIVHRDLKPSNLLLSSIVGMPTVKIADFGFARHLEPNHMAETLCGSPLYMAPEILQYKPYDGKADLWSLGVIMFEMLTGQVPFPARATGELVKMQKMTNISFPSHIPLDPDAKDLVRQLLEKDPHRRISFEALFNHRYLQPSKKIRARSKSAFVKDPYTESTHPGPMRSPLKASLLLDVSPTDTSPAMEAYLKEENLSQSVDTRKALQFRGLEDEFIVLHRSDSPFEEVDELVLIEKRIKSAEVVALVASSKTGEKATEVEAFVLYIKALSILDIVIEEAEELLHSTYVESPRLLLAFDHAKELFCDYVQKAGYWRRSLSPKNSVPPVPVLLYQMVVEYGLKAVSAESMNESTAALEHYHHVISLLDQLAIDINHPNDRAAIASIRSGLNHIFQPKP